MRNGFNQFSVPYMNELTANALGVASVFGGNMPVSYINTSLGRIGNFLQQKQDKIEVMPPGYDPSIGMPVPKPSTKTIPKTPGQTQAEGIFGLPDYSKAGTPPIAGQNNSTCAWWDLICKANEIQGKPKTQAEANEKAMPKNEDGTAQTPFQNYSSDLFIIVIGVVLLIVAIISLR